MIQDFWFNRMVEYWSLPLQIDIVDLVRRGRIQMVQAGTFCPQFYSLAGDDALPDRHWAGMPLIGVRENLALAADLIPKIRQAGAKFIGQMSMSWHYGDHETGKGLFGVWDDIWTDDLLGTPPCADPQMAQERIADGTIRNWPIQGRPYRTYCGCISNPYWVATLKPMVKKAIALGVDGLMVHHNFTAFCHCDYCQDYLRPRLRERLDPAVLEGLFGTANVDAIPGVHVAPPDAPADLKAAFDLAVNQLTHLRRKEAFDDIFTGYGRSLKPDLIVSQWYHKYNFKVHDERSLLPDDLWAKDEDYIWYSQGGSKGMSVIRHGYLADMGLPARFTYAAGGGRPFVINKYDYRRFRLSIAEAGANHAAAPAFHWSPQAEPGYDLADYTAPVVRYHRFLADHDRLIHPAVPWSQIALVYPRRAEVAGESGATAPLKRIGRLMEDAHLLFDMITDAQLLSRIDDYETVILPNIRRMTRDEADRVRTFVARGGRLVLAGENGVMTPDGEAYDSGLFADWTPPAGPGHSVLYLPDGPWDPQEREVKPGLSLPVYPLPEGDTFGQAVRSDLERLCGRLWLKTDAPWFVRVRAWRPERENAIVLHWVNYRQDEDTVMEVPQPVGPIQVECTTPAGYEITGVTWHYPEMREPVELPHESSDRGVRFSIPTLIVYGLSVLHLRKI